MTHSCTYRTPPTPTAECREMTLREELAAWDQLSDEAWAAVDAMIRAPDIIQSIRDALAHGQHLQARKLSEIGIAQYPDDDEMRKMARILGPPRVVRTGIMPE